MNRNPLEMGIQSGMFVDGDEIPQAIFDQHTRSKSIPGNSNRVPNPEASGVKIAPTSSEVLPKKTLQQAILEANERLVSVTAALNRYTRSFDSRYDEVQDDEYRLRELLAEGHELRGRREGIAKEYDRLVQLLYQRRHSPRSRKKK